MESISAPFKWGMMVTAPKSGERGHSASLLVHINHSYTGALISVTANDPDLLDATFRQIERSFEFQQMPPEISRIRSAPYATALIGCHFYIGIVTGQRDHAWITAESAHALAKNKEVVLILQDGVKFNPTFYERDREHLIFTDIIDETFIGLLEDFRSRDVLGLR